jgi:hypothetical protein
MSDIDLRDISNGRVSSRIRQVVVLFLAVVVGILISISCSAQHQRENTRFNKARYKTQMSTYAKACTLLEKKRNQKPKSFFANKRNGRKSLAEVDLTL